MSLILSRYRSGIATSRLAPERLETALLAVERQSPDCPIDLESLWAELSPDRSVDILSWLIKADLRGRFARGERPDVAAYLARFAALRENRERVVSLVYEEFCLLKEQGIAPVPEEFCGRYEPWRDSLLEQLRCHELLSQAAGARPSMARFPSPGDRFRSFRLKELLGQGGSARVFLANDESLGDREVALKLSSERGTEASIQGRLDHANIVPVLSVIDDAESGLRALCMPYRAGKTLEEVIHLINPESRPRFAAILRQVLAAPDGQSVVSEPSAPGWQGFPTDGTYAEGVAWIGSMIAGALSYAHGRSVYHRDVKPANVLLTVREGPQLLDFNLAHAPHSADRAQSALRGGTLPYMAPEQLEAFLDADKWGNVGQAAEVYALGLLLLELLTGRRPQAPDPKLPLPRAIRELLDHRLAENALDLSRGQSIPRGLETILSRCLAPTPQDRYPSAAALANDLRRFAENRRRIGRRVRGVALAATVLGVIAGLGGFWLVRSERINAPQFVAEAFLAIEKQQWTQARKSVKRAKRGDPLLYQVYWASSVVNGKDGNLAAALEDADRAIALSSRSIVPLPAETLVKLHLQRAAVLVHLKRPEEAKASYRKAIEVAPKLPSSYANLGAITARDGEFEVAIEAFANALELGEFGPNQVNQATLGEYHVRLATIYLDYGNQIQAKGTAHDVIRAEPCYLHAEQRLTTAKELAQRRAIAADKPWSDPDRLTWDLLAARAQIALGDVASAREDYHESVRRFEAANSLIQNAAARSGRGRSLDVLRGQVVGRLEIDRPKVTDKAVVIHGHK